MMVNPVNPLKEISSPVNKNYDFPKIYGLRDELYKMYRDGIASKGEKFVKYMELKGILDEAFKDPSFKAKYQPPALNYLQNVNAQYFIELVDRGVKFSSPEQLQFATDLLDALKDLTGEAKSQKISEAYRNVEANDHLSGDEKREYTLIISQIKEAMALKDNTLPRPFEMS